MNNSPIQPVTPDEDGCFNLNTIKLDKELNKNIEIIKTIFIDDDTLITRPIVNQNENNIKCCVLFIDGMVNNEIINENIIKPIVQNTMLKKASNTIDIICMQVLFSNEVTKTENLNDIVKAILYGDTILFVDGSNFALIINSKGWQTRSITEPDSEKSLRGPREGFTESIMTNLSLIRRKLRTSDLKFKFKTIGTRSNTTACMCYIDSLVDKNVLAELNTRLDKIVMDGILDTNYISECMKDSPFTPFKTIGVTERPDSIAGKLLEGRIAIILDGTPQVLTIPYLLIENFQSSDDYYLNFYFASIGRMLRIIGFILSTSVPSIYVAIVTFHKEMIPTPLALSIAQSSQGVPFPTIVECALMLLVFEIIREAGIRMPSNIGQALSIVGALVIGQAAVEAKFISAPMVIIVAITAITGLINPKTKGISIILRFSFLIATFLLGFYGYFFSLFALLIHIFSLRSFGVEYTSQLTSFKGQEMKDNFLRAPWWKMKTRPVFSKRNKVRRN